jgi:hypothetical protein
MNRSDWTFDPNDVMEEVTSDEDAPLSTILKQFQDAERKLYGEGGSACKKNKVESEVAKYSCTDDVMKECDEDEPLCKKLEVMVNYSTPAASTQDSDQGDACMKDAPSTKKNDPKPKRKESLVVRIIKWQNLVAQRNARREVELARKPALTLARAKRSAMLTEKQKNKHEVRTVCSCCGQAEEGDVKFSICEEQIGNIPPWNFKTGQPPPGITMKQRFALAWTQVQDWEETEEIMDPAEDLLPQIQAYPDNTAGRRECRLRGAFHALKCNWMHVTHVADPYDEIFCPYKTIDNPWKVGFSPAYLYGFHGDSGAPLLEDDDDIVLLDMYKASFGWRVLEMICGKSICNVCRVLHCGCHDLDLESFCVACNAKRLARIEARQQLKESSKQYYATRSTPRDIFGKSLPLPSDLAGGDLTAATWAEKAGRFPLNGRPKFSKSEFNALMRTETNPLYQKSFAFQPPYVVNRDPQRRPQDMSEEECRYHHGDKVCNTVLETHYVDAAGRFRPHGVHDVEFKDSDIDESDCELREEHEGA